jgi:hypothetical protein
MRSFRNTQPQSTKKLFKTNYGVLNYIKPRIEDQNNRFGVNNDK